MTFLTLWLLCGIGAAIVASNRGSSGCLWFALGVILGPIGFALAFANGRRCPHCSSRISTRAAVCPRCQRPLREPAPARPASEAKPAGASSAANEAGVPEVFPSGVAFCPRCGHPQSGENYFCSACGSKMRR